MKYNLIIADDHKMFLEGMLSMLEDQEQYHIMFTAKSGENIIKYLQINSSNDIDLIITDITMPDVDGIALNSFVKENHPDLKILVVSMHHDPGMINTLIKKDVDGYIPKNAEKRELLLAIQTILSGKKYFSSDIKEVYMNSIFHKKKDVLISLTKRERDVLKLIAQEHTTQEIADTLFLSKHTVESYRKNLISKLNVRNLAGLTKYAIKLGLID